MINQPVEKDKTRSSKRSGTQVENEVDSHANSGDKSLPTIYTVGSVSRSIQYDSEKSVSKVNKIVTIRRGQLDRFNKGPSENNHRIQGIDKDNPKESIQTQRNTKNTTTSQIEIELNKNQINSTDCDVQSFNDNEASSSNSDNGDKDVDDDKHDEPKQQVFENMKPTASNDKDKDKKNNKGEAEDRDDDGVIVLSLIGVIALDAESDSDSKNHSDGEDKEDREDNDRTVIETLKITPGFLSKQNGIFGDSNGKDDQPRKKPMKTKNSLLSRLKSIFTDNNDSNNPDEANNNLINSNINPTNR